MSKDIEKKLEAILKNVNPLAEYRDDLDLRSDLDLDSLDVISFLFEVESQMNIKIPEGDIEAKGLMKMGNLCSYIKEKISAMPSSVTS